METSELHEKVIKHVLSEPMSTMVPSNLEFSMLEHLLRSYLKDPSNLLQIAIVYQMIQKKSTDTMNVSEKEAFEFVDAYSHHINNEINRRKGHSKISPVRFNQLHVAPHPSFVMYISDDYA